MGLVDVAVPNLLGGVGQQAPAVRPSNQLADAENVLLHVVNGLGKRKGTRHIAKLFDGQDTVLRVHYIDRDPDERYVVLIGHKQVRVFNARDGHEHPVATSAPVLADPYLDSRIPPNYQPTLDTGSSSFSNFAEDFGGGRWTGTDWERNTVTGEGPFYFGAGDGPNIFRCGSDAASAATVTATADQNASGAEIFVPEQVFSIYFKKAPGFDITDVVLGFRDTTNVVNHTARFDFDVDGVPTAGPVSTGVVSGVEGPEGDGWYRCWIKAEVGLIPTTDLGDTRLVTITYDSTVPGTPSNKQLFHFGARIDEGVDEPQPYTQTDPNWLKALTIADTTLILNTSILAQLDATATNPLTNRRGYFWVRQGGVLDVTYTVTVGYVSATVPGSFSFSMTTPNAGTTGLRTDEDIAEDLRVGLDANANLVAVREGSVVQVRHTSEDADNYITSVLVSDSRGDTSMVAVTLNDDGVCLVNKFTDLPLIFDADQYVLVTGDPERGADDYYVKFVADTATAGNLGRGHWEESLRPRVLSDADFFSVRLDQETMPHSLTRAQDDAAGTVTGIGNEIYFVFDQVTWDDMLVGDDVSNPAPAFAGEAIADLFLYRGRLGFLSSSDVTLSEAAEVFNFWRTTVLDLVDTDLISLSSGARESLDLKHAAAGLDTCLLFSARQQFELLGDPTLSPATAQLVLARAFDGIGTASPANTGRGVQFVREVGAFAALMETTKIGDATNFRVEDLTVQAPRFLAEDVRLLTHSNLVDLSALLAAADRSVLYVHQSFYDDAESRLQSAIHRWTLGGDIEVHGLGFFDTDLTLVAAREEGWFLEKVDCSTEILEADGRPVVHLDRRLTEAQVTAVYDGPNNRTDITLPYEVPAGVEMEVVDVESGLLIPVQSSTATTLRVGGDVSESLLYIGESFEMVAVLSEPVIREAGARGPVARMGRPLDIHQLHLYLADTAFLRVEVARDLRGSTFEEFSAAGLGTGLLDSGELNRYTGAATFAVIGTSVEADVTLHNATPFPSYVQGARWDVLYNPRTHPAG